MEVNLIGVHAVTRAFLPLIRRGRGRIVQMSSISGKVASPWIGPYTASKHALVGLTRNTAWMYAKQGIRCNAICPGGTRTNIAETMPQDRLDPAGAARG